MKTYILNTADYTFAPYSDGGFSGKLLLATAKTPDLPKLLIKSDNPSSACNEFMYSRLAELISVSAPKAYIMDIAESDKHLFGSPYVVGIEFLEGLQSFTLEEMRSSEESKAEYAAQYALAAMFDQADRVQLMKSADGHIIGFDFTETFWLSDLSPAAFRFSDDDLADIIAQRLLAHQRQNFCLMANAGAKVLQEHFALPGIQMVYPYYLAPMEMLRHLTENQIVELTDVLCEIYSISIAVFYEEYITILKKEIAGYFKAIGYRPCKDEIIPADSGAMEANKQWKI